MKIAIIGYGKMGKMVEQVALKRGHAVSCIIDADDIHLFETPEFRHSDVAIEFTTPSTAADNVIRAFAAGVPVVSGTTGWTDSIPEMKQLCDEGKGTLLQSSNFSIGVNVFRAVNRYLARIMNRLPQYSPSMTEVHHIHKLDHPSGTAITLAEEIVEGTERISRWQETDSRMVDILPIKAVREGEVPGIHTVTWDSPVDSITITHSAKSREGFALGAVMAAEWLKGKKGFFTITDMMKETLGIS